MPRNVLVVDDDEIARKLLKEILEKEGFRTTLASSGEEAISLANKHSFPLVVSDIRMLEMDGIDVLKFFRKTYPTSVVILMTAFGSMETAVGAIKEGAFDYISKPFKVDQFKSVFLKAAKQAESLLKLSPNGKITTSIEPSKVMIGSSARMLEIFKTLARAAMSEASVLITGESGTGKELIARAIHQNSPRREKKFVAVNCGALTDSLLESELFGHVKGSFTGAQENRKGLFEESNNGTLFLDEVGDISSQMQVKLLRALQEGEIRPVGTNESKKVDVRVLAATHRNLFELVNQGRFREDLYYRLKVISFEIPPLRERKEDIPELASFFLSKYSKKNRKPVALITPKAMATLSKYSWPGNVRELENTIERAVALANTGQVDYDDLPEEITRAALYKDEPLKETTSGNTTSSLEEMEKGHILQVLQQVHYNKSKAADLLGIDRATLYRKALKYKIDLKEK